MFAKAPILSGTCKDGKQLWLQSFPAAFALLLFRGSTVDFCREEGREESDERTGRTGKVFD